MSLGKRGELPDGPGKINRQADHLAGLVLKKQVVISESVKENFIRNFHVFEAVFSYFIYLAFLKPFQGLESAAALFDSQCLLGNPVEAQSIAQLFVNFF